MADRCEDCSGRFPVKPGMTSAFTLEKTVFILLRKMVALMARKTVLVLVREMVVVMARKMVLNLTRKMVAVKVRERVLVLVQEMVVVMARKRGLDLARKMVAVMADSDRPSGEKRGEDPCQSGGQARPKGETFGHLEGRGDVSGLLVHGDAGLGAGAAGPDEEVRPDLREIPGPARNDDRGGVR